MRRKINPTWRRTTATLRVQCWCQTEIIEVDAGEIMEGKTGSCGREWCHDDPADSTT